MPDSVFSRRATAHRSLLFTAALLSIGLGAGTATAQKPQVLEPTDATRRHLAAHRAKGRIVLDGRLDEPDWVAAPVATDFVQVRPDYVPTSRFVSEVRVLYDADNLYIGAFNRDSAGLSTLRLPDLRRDFEPPETDVFSVTLGPLGDRRTALQFHTTPLGSQSDVQAFDGGESFSFNWDAVWRVRTTRADSGWIAEISIPWQSLRYATGLNTWDINFLRNARHAAQWSAWVPYPRQLTSWRLNYSGALDSIQPPPPRTNIRIRPYALGQVARDRTPNAFNGSTGDVGGEVIWAPTSNSLLEATINTDFAQADVDRQVVNLTRFNVFFPERRQFFLENADLLNAGGLSPSTFSGNGVPSVAFAVQPFFTRRIGLGGDGTLLPIDAGIRYAYRAAHTTVGALAMRQASVRGSGATSFAIARGSQTFGRGTRIGTTVSLREGGSTGTNVVTSVDAFTRLGQVAQASAMVSTSTFAGRTGLAATYTLSRVTTSLATALTGALVNRDYNPQTGFVSRGNVLLTAPAVVFTVQPPWRPHGVVWMRPAVTTAFYHDPSSLTLQEGQIALSSEVLFRNGATISPTFEQNFQRPTAPVALLPNVQIAPGTHDYKRGGVVLKSDQSAKVAATATLTTGGFFDGSLDRAEIATRWSPTPYVALRGAYEVNRLRSIGTRDSSFVTHLAGPELRLFLNPRVQWSAFYQYNTSVQRGSLNARFSWEFAPLSYVFVVYNDRQAIQDGTTPGARSLIVKVSWLRQM